MINKLESLARLSNRLGFTAILNNLPRKPGLSILAYHRIGDSLKSRYDRGVFTATTADFERQIHFLKSHYRVIGLREWEETVEQGRPPTSFGVMVTFDDGYLDNFRVAYPILKRHGIPATFFLPTAFVGSNLIPWWDSISYMVRESRTEILHIDYPQAHTFDLSMGREIAIPKILRIYCMLENSDTARFMLELQERTGVEIPESADHRRFLDWKEAQEMMQNGMEFASHTHTHPVMSKLSLKQQLEQLQVSRNEIRDHLGLEVKSLAYPVGRPDCFSADTRSALRQSGYTTAFSFYGGVNRSAGLDQFNFLRIEPMQVFAFPVQIGGAAVFGRDIS
jgi:peptidoglycan/xylan/chitin deacetylase (PgdA/CDA1 family)